MRRAKEPKVTWNIIIMTYSGSGKPMKLKNPKMHLKSLSIQIAREIS
jgi:hypothetical protein